MKTVKPICPLEDGRLQRAQHTRRQQVGPLAAFWIFFPDSILKLSALAAHRQMCHQLQRQSHAASCKQQWELQRCQAVPTTPAPPPYGADPRRPRSLLDPTTVSHRSGSLVLHTSRYSLNMNSSLSPTSHYYVFNHFPRNTRTHARTHTHTHTHSALATFRSTVHYKKHTVCYADKHNLSFVQVCPCKVARSLTKRYVFVWTQCSSSLCWTKNMANTTCSSCRDFYSQNIWEDD